MKPLASIISNHDVPYHFVADDSHLYLEFKVEKDAISEAIERCVWDVRAWMQQNMLKLNDNKTEVIVFGSRQKLKEMDKQYVTRTYF